MISQYACLLKLAINRLNFVRYFKLSLRDISPRSVKPLQLFIITNLVFQLRAENTFFSRFKKGCSAIGNRRRQIEWSRPGFKICIQKILRKKNGSIYRLCILKYFLYTDWIWSAFLYKDPVYINIFRKLDVYLSMGWQFVNFGLYIPLHHHRLLLHFFSDLNFHIFG